MRMEFGKKLSAVGAPIARTMRGLAAAVGLVALAGCMTPGPYDAARVGPFYVPANHAGDPHLGAIRRVVLLPVFGGTVASSEMAAALDPVLAAALQREKRFEVVTLSRENSLRRFRAEAVSSAGALPADMLAVLRQEFAADAVMFVDLTVYRAYRPLALGLRAKLAAIDGTRLVWTFDDTFSAENPLVANAARHHFVEEDHSGVPADFTPAVLQSPTKFAAYAATAMFSTLPPVAPAILPAGSAGRKLSR